MGSVFFTPLSIFIFFVLRATSKINGIFQNKIKVTLNECSITALGNKEICEKTHHLNLIVVRKHLLRPAPLPSNITAQKTLTQLKWMNEIGKYCLFCDYMLSWKLICCKRYRLWCTAWDHWIKWRANDKPRAQQLSPPPSAAWLIYIPSINIQMKMARLVMEIGMQTHIMPPHHFVEIYTCIQSAFS